MEQPRMRSSCLRSMSAMVALLAAAGCATERTSATLARRVFSSEYEATVNELIAGWPRESQALGNALLVKYGQPQEATPSRLIWHNRVPWKRIELSREAILHRFPKPHHDLLLQVVDYRVPVERVGELLAFNGSLIPDRTAGELAARSDSEAANILALNLADEVVKGQRTPDQARAFYAEAIDAQRPEYLRSLRFPIVRPSADADQELIPPRQGIAEGATGGAGAAGFRPAVARPGPGAATAPGAVTGSSAAGQPTRQSSVPVSSAQPATASPPAITIPAYPTAQPTMPTPATISPAPALPSGRQPTPSEQDRTSQAPSSSAERRLLMANVSERQSARRVAP